jgi:hypothetical protein
MLYFLPVRYSSLLSLALRLFDQKLFPFSSQEVSFCSDFGSSRAFHSSTLLITALPHCWHQSSEYTGVGPFLSSFWTQSEICWRQTSRL